MGPVFCLHVRTPMLQHHKLFVTSENLELLVERAYVFQVRSRMRVLLALILESKIPGKLKWVCYSICISMRKKQ